MTFRHSLPLFLAALLVPAVLPGADKDYSAELPRVAPREPADALKTFKLRPGFRIELVASEPLIRSPVALDFDEDGRLFVVEFPEYNQYANPKFKGHGCVKLLEDTHGDGRYDRATVYADNLDSPVAVACYGGGVFVGSVPDILYCKGEVRKPVFSGFARDEAGEAMLNSFRWGLDNRFHVSTNLAGGLVRRADDKDGKPVDVRGQGFLFDPAALTFALTSGGGQHGMSLDDWGRTFVCENSNPIHLVMYDSRYLARNPYVQSPAAAVNIAPEGKYTRLFRLSPNEPWRVLRTQLRKEGVVPGSDEGGQPSGFFTGATGVTVYRGDAWPEEYRGNVFVGEVANNLVYRARLEPNGVGLTALRADRDVEFLASSDNWFRPVQFANGPDGCLYVIDMYRELIEGAKFLPPQILKHLDVSSGIDRGRIYRIVPEGFKRPKLPRLGQATTAELVALLEHPDGWHRDTASRLLYQRQDRAAVAPLKRLAAASKSPLGRTHALYALDGLKALEARQVLKGLDDPDAHVREHAVRLAEPFEEAPEVRAKLGAMTGDGDVRVRYQLAFSLGSLGGEVPAKALGKLAVSDGADAWFRLAILSSAGARGGELFGALAADKAVRGTAHGKALLAALAVQTGAANRANEVAAVVKALDDLPDSEKALAQEVVRSLVSRQPAAGRAKLSGAGGGKAGALLAELLRDARRTAADERRPAAERAAAVRALGLAPFAEGRDLFADCLKPRQPQPVQAAALETLARFDDSDVPALILATWPGLSPRQRATAAETLFARPAWVGAFLDAVEAGKVKTGDVDPARIQLLQGSADKALRARAARLFAGTALSRRADVVASYQKALTLPGDAARGKALFKNVCSSCHRLEGVGEAVGAELLAIRDRGNEAIVLNVLDPNREVLPKYLSYYLETEKGRTLTGMITAETANDITICRADGTSETVLRVNIADLRSTGMSFMPEGLEKQVDLQGMADLLAYLNSIKQAAREAPTMTQEQASAFARLALKGIRKEYPNKPGDVVNGEADVKSPRATHPAFYGCYDWHSSVHGHWMLVRLLRLFPELPEGKEIRAALAENLTAKHLQAEADYFATPNRRSFERTYGWAWLLKLAEELHGWDDPQAREWSKNLRPLADTIVDRYLAFLPKQTYPIRSGVHPNTAFGLAFALDYARAVGHERLRELIEKRSRDYFARDVGIPASWEPDGADFISPSLMEADLMRRVLPPAEFPTWLRRFLPDLTKGEPKTLFESAKVTDRSDPQLVHLDGLNLSRAWCLRSIAAALPRDDPARKVLAESATRHAEAALRHVASGDYVGEHWLASFAVYLLSTPSAD